MRRATRLFTLEQQAKLQSSPAPPSGPGGKQLSQAEMDELSRLKPESTSTKKWYQHMRTAACIGLLRPNQLVGIGAVPLCAASSLVCCFVVPEYHLNAPAS